MKRLLPSKFLSVILLTALVLTSLSSCSLHHVNRNECKSHAYIQLDLKNYLSNRFNSGAPVRLAVTPFSVPANLTGWGSSRPSFGQELARQVQASLLRAEAFPIIELLDREDWPNKRDEFFRGNFEGISLAREAGYDFVLLGLVQELNSSDLLAVDSKIIEVESGITIWYGKTEVSQNVTNIEFSRDKMALLDHSLPFDSWNANVKAYADCLADEVTKDPNNLPEK